MEFQLWTQVTQEQLVYKDLQSLLIASGQTPRTSQQYLSQTLKASAKEIGSFAKEDHSNFQIAWTALENVCTCWKKNSELLLQGKQLEDLKEDEQDLKKSSTLLASRGLSSLVSEYLFDCIQTCLEELAPKFWKLLESVEVSECASRFAHLHQFIDQMEKVVSLTHTASQTSNLKQVLSTYQTLYHALLFARSQTLNDILYQFFDKEFTQCSNGHDQREQDDLESLEEQMQEDNAEGFTKLRQFCDHLQKLNLIAVSEPIFSQILFEQIENRIKSTCAGKFEEPMMESITQWMNKCLHSDFLKLMEYGSTETTNSIFLQWKTRLEYFIYEEFANLRIGELFDIIVNYPDSTPSLLDLRDCLAKTNQHKQLASSLKKAFSKRLLHPGANTSDIITQYINTIKALKLIDPSGITLDSVSEPIKIYLSGRDDTVRCIVYSVTDPNSELAEELAVGDGVDGNIDIEDDEVEENEEQWMPDPIDADPNNRIYHKQDMINTLVNVYGGADLFINEYRSMLADKLLALTDYNTENEIRILELLKLRFGESGLHNCEIMIKDMAESKRVNNNCRVHSLEDEQGTTNDFGIDSTIISYLFWPHTKDEKFRLPDVVSSKMERYAKSYSKLKPTRSLDWKPNLGTVELELEIGSSVVEFSVSPLHATVIMHFQEKETWILKELASKMDISPELLRKRIIFWINNGIITEIAPATYKLVEEVIDNVQVNAVEEDQEEVSALQQQRKEALEVCEKYVVGMLKTFGQLPLERISAMLSSFVDNYNFSVQELKDFLAKLVAEDKVEVSGGVYTLKK